MGEGLNKVKEKIKESISSVICLCLFINVNASNLRDRK